MSPHVKLVLYPDGDSAFASHASVGLTLDLPVAYSVTDVVEAIQDHLRVVYPLALIRVDVDLDGKYDATWHVYRDGLPTTPS
jgi:hypothetical protein